MYVVIEGIDTCGKSTQINLLKRHFINAIFTKEPSDSAIGQFIRTNLELHHKFSARAEFLLFLADRAEHIDSVIMPNHNSKLIISDRSLISGIAYVPFDKKDEQELAFVMNVFATSNIMPDLCVMLELSESSLKDRLGSKTQDLIEQRGIAYLLDIQEKIKLYAKRLAKHLVIVDASYGREEIQTTIIKEIEKAL
ncbi:dTMP kinase [Helicobacter fennelliae]|uniref:Thymidylate kinase n=1 Tax=Helicobacter fennelliae MRY12-0050 TaxID=1325130 RepID=T1CSR3_9HELI|nr:dTMP kinase [Helicobacter fennelliae]GAD19874.1 thymidylate kinase [Helicobacter fennelliae MRY12-0050]STP08055.1 thymidylate kinase [Helicobacter fennelliae]